MSEAYPQPDFPLPESQAVPRRRRSWAWVAWIVIIGLCAFMVFGRRAAQEEREEAGEDKSADVMLKFQGRYLVGANNAWSVQNLFRSALALRNGGVDHRLRFVVLANELAGPAEALKQLDLLDKEMAEYKVQPTPDQARLRSLLGRLFQDYRNGRLMGPSSTWMARA